jgi:hypothetical protein
VSIELFRPSNATHGEFFHEEFCYRCAKFPRSSDAKNQCVIFLSAQAYSIDEPEYPRQWRYVDGAPTCTAFKDREEFNRERREKRSDIISTDRLEAAGQIRPGLITRI